MLKRPFDILTIGDITTDAFIRLKEASVHCNINNEKCQICMAFGAKVPFEFVKVVKAVGNAANAAVSASRLGLRSALISNLGNDENGRECLQELSRNKVTTEYVKKNHNKPTNYHFVLWYEAERTILVNHIDYHYSLPSLPKTKWIYLTSLAAKTESYHSEIANYLEENPEVRLIFQPGTFQLKLGFDGLKDIYRRTDIFAVNFEEAQGLLNTDSRDIKTLMKKIMNEGPKLVLVTDGPKGAYMYDGERAYYMPIYPDPKEPLERTGCGDAFASTFVSALIMNRAPLEALTWAPVNPMSVVQAIGAQEGLLTKQQLDWWLKRAPHDYRVKEI